MNSKSATNLHRYILQGALFLEETNFANYQPLGSRSDSSAITVISKICKKVRKILEVTVQKKIIWYSNALILKAHQRLKKINNNISSKGVLLFSNFRAFVSSPSFCAPHHCMFVFFRQRWGFDHDLCIS